MTTPRLAFVGDLQAAAPSLCAAAARAGMLEAACDLSGQFDAAKLSARWTFSDLSELLSESEPDGIVLLAAFSDRPRLIKQCLAAGAGVMVLGPPGPVAACNRLSLFSKLSGRAVLAAPAIRFSPALALARRLIDSGKLANPVSMTIQGSRRGMVRSAADDSGAVPIDQAFEAADLVHYLLGPLDQVSAFAHADGVLVCSGLTRGGAAVSIVLHASGPLEAVGLEFEIRSSDGTRLHMDRSFRVVCGNGSRIDGVHRPTLAAADPVVELGYDGILREFRRLLMVGRGQGPGLVGPVATICEATRAILASAVRGRAMSAHRARPDRTLAAETTPG